MNTSSIAAAMCAAAIAAAALPGWPAPGASSSTPSAQYFPFVIPWNDASPGADNVSWLNSGAAGSNGYIVARGGHFVASKTGRRIRFLGVDFTFASDFPTHADADAIAAHLAKLGIDIVRIHHEDYNDGELWDKRFPGHLRIDPAAFDRLDYLVSRLKAYSIYVDLNLHVSRQFTAADGFPPSVDRIPSYDKRVDYFDPRMIALQKSFAKAYLTHINPYTKLSFADDPCVAMIEINNEDSLVSDAYEQGADGLDDLPEPFRGELVTLWNGWLAQKYGSSVHLAAAWRAGAGALRPSLVGQGAHWTLEQNSVARASLSAPVAAMQPSDTAPAEDFDIASIDGVDWHVQAGIEGLDLHDGAVYTVSFEARSDAPRTLSVYAGRDIADWRHIGLDATVALGPAWTPFTFVFQAKSVVPRHSRIVFVLGNRTGSVDLRDLRVQPGASQNELLGGGSLSAATVPMPLSAGTAAQSRDWLQFLAHTERVYAGGMRHYLKDVLKVHASVICSQISWGNAEGPLREESTDFADNHAYWQHPTFPAAPWDPVNWRIANTPMVADMADGGGGTLRSLAEYRIAGKPYTVTEYNEPAPSDYRCEAVPELSAFAASQDWDGIFLFDYGSYGAGAPNDRVQGFFATGSDPARAAFLPAAALIFRDAEMRPDGPAERLDLPIRQALTAVPLGDLWSEAGGGEPDYFTERLSTALTASGPLAVTRRSARPTSGGDAGAGFVRHGSDPASAYFTAGSVAAFGFLGGHIIRLGTVGIDFGRFGDNFCAVTVTPNRPPTGARGVLITLVGKVKNDGMVWNADRTSVADRWGHSPSLAEFVPATITLPAPAGAAVYALSGAGRPTALVPSADVSGRLTFSTSPAYRTIWYEVAAQYLASVAGVSGIPGEETALNGQAGPKRHGDPMGPAR